MKNIIFDFGNVLVQWHPELVYGDYFGDEAKAWWFLRHVADMDWRQRIDAGEIQYWFRILIYSGWSVQPQLSAREKSDGTTGNSGMVLPSMIL